MHLRRKPLPGARGGAYTSYVAETTANGFSSPANTGGQPPHAAIFSSVMPSRASINGRALVGRVSALPVPVFRSANPISCPPTSFSSERRASNANTGGRVMRLHPLAHTGQTESPIEIIRAALREAATAPTVIDALDVTGDALRRLAEIVCAEDGRNA